MSQIIVNIPDCATGSHDDSDVITITTENCGPAPAPGPRQFPGTGEWIGGFLMLVAVLAAIVATRWKSHDTKPARLAEQNRARQIELDAEVKMAALHRTCGTCGDKYEPELKS